MRNIKQINIKNRTYYFVNDVINIKDFDYNLLKIDKKKFIQNFCIWIHYNKQIMIMKVLIM